MEQVGKYRIDTHIASGGMAEIYKGRLEGPHGFVKDVVIKAVHPHLLKDDRYIRFFLREAKLWAKLNHSSIVQVYEFFEEKGRFYLVMEYVKGADLLKMIRRARENGTSVSIPIAIRIFQSVLSALDYAHNFKDEKEEISGIVHRDISPQNILISVNGDVKITDFGIAKASLSSGLTTQGTLVGKIDYMSPEQASAKEVDHRTDIFSAGIVLWETLTDNKLFYGDTDIEVLEKVRRCEIIRPSAINPEIDEELERIIMKALQSDRDNRYRSAAEFSESLTSYLRRFPHDISEENISDFMHKLFPEFISDVRFKTQLLEDEESDNRGEKTGKRAKYIIFAIFFVLMIVSAIVFYPSGSITLSNDVNNVPMADMSDSSGTLDILDIKIEDASDSGYLSDISFSDLSGVTLKQETGEGIAEKKLHRTISRSEIKNNNAPIKSGRISINAIPWADIYIGKKKIGTTPIFDYELKSGKTEIIFKNGELNIVRKKIIEILPDKEIKHTEDLTK